MTAGDLTVKSETVYAPLVPSAKVESPLLDQYGGYTGKTMVATTDSTRSISCRFVHITGNQSRTYVQRGVLPKIALGKWQDIRDTGAGQMTGSGTGTIIFATGSAAITLDALPDPDSAIVFSYVAQNDDEVTIRTGSVPVDDMTFRHTVEKPGIKPGSMTVTYVSSGENKTLTDQANGLLTGDGSSSAEGSGAIHYAPGELSFKLDFLPDSGTEIQLTYEQGTSADNENITSPELTIDLLPLMDNTVLLPGSVIFEWNGETYFDRDGSLYKNLSTETNAGVQVGRIDYSGGMATLASYPEGTVNTATIQAAATIGVGFKIDAVAFRTPGAPIRQGSLQLTAVRVDNGDIITATANFNGEINTAEVVGKIDVTTGWCELQFTDGGSPEKTPIYVIPQSVHYNCVVETSLPLDAELIGLDPVRLPPDGKVPIYRAGDIVVISHTASTDAGTPNAGQVMKLARDHQAEIVVEDSSGALLASDQYTVDREAGTETNDDFTLQIRGDAD